MITTDVTQLELVGCNYINPHKSCETGDFQEELLNSISNELLQNKSIQEIIRKRSDKSNIFEHYADFDIQNYKFLLENLNLLALQVNQFVGKLQNGEINMTKEDVSSRFEELFSAFDQKFGTSLRYDFSDAIEQLSKFRNYDNVGNLVKDAFKLMQNIFETSNEKFPIIDKLQISEFMADITDRDTENLTLIKQLDKLSKLDFDKIINHLKIKNISISENSNNVNSQKQNSINDKDAFSNGDDTLSIINEISAENNPENPFEHLPNFKQQENNFSQMAQKENTTNINSIILNNSILRSSVANINTEQITKTEQSSDNYTFSNVRINDFVRTVGGFIRSLGGENQSTAKLILEPQWLGTVIVDIVMKNDTAEIKIKARSKDTIEIIEQQISSLKDKLQENGINVGRMDLTQEKQDESEFVNYDKEDESKKDNREFLKSYLNKNENSEQDKDGANVGFRLWMEKIIEKYI